MIASIFRNIDETVAAGGKIRFNVDAPFNPTKAFDTSPANSSNYNSYTSQELRYVMQKHPNHVVFYRDNKEITRAALGI